GHVEAEALLAAVCAETGRLDEAVRLASGVVGRAPRSPRALEVLAVARARQGDATGARRAFNALVEAVPDGWSQLNNFGVFELEARDYKAAARLFMRAVDIHPGNRDGWRGLQESARALQD